MQDFDHIIHLSAVRKTFVGPAGPIHLDAASHYAYRFSRIGRIGEDGSIEVVDASPEQIKPVPYPTTRSRQQWEAFLAERYQQWGNRWSAPDRKEDE